MTPTAGSPAKPATSVAFEGFSPDAIQFLVDLAANNDRAWFQPRKAEYERLLKAPLEALCVALDERFQRRGIPLSADPAVRNLLVAQQRRKNRCRPPGRLRKFGE